jgi:hypothetical protein
VLTKPAPSDMPCFAGRHEGADRSRSAALGVSARPAYLTDQAPPGGPPALFADDTALGVARYRLCQEFLM